MKQLFAFIFKGILAAILTYIGLRVFKSMDHGTIVSAAGVLSTVAGILFGFVLAAVSIFSSANSDDGIIDALKRNKVLPNLINKLLDTGITLILACIFPLIAMFLPNTPEVTSFDFVFILIGLAYLLISMLTFYLCWRKLSWIFPHM